MCMYNKKNYLTRFKQINSGSFKNITYKLFAYPSRSIKQSRDDISVSQITQPI